MAEAPSGPSPTVLDSIKVLDRTDQAAAYAGRLLADLGADVVRVEPGAGAARGRKNGCHPGRDTRSVPLSGSST